MGNQAEYDMWDWVEANREAAQKAYVEEIKKIVNHPDFNWGMAMDIPDWYEWIKEHSGEKL